MLSSCILNVHFWQMLVAFFWQTYHFCAYCKPYDLHKWSITCTGRWKSYLLTMKTTDLSFHLEKYTLSSDQKSNESLSDIFIPFKVFIFLVAPSVLLFLTVPTAFTFWQAKFSNKLYLVKKLSKMSSFLKIWMFLKNINHALHNTYT